jgi:uncharacterized coiled-coil DUF342 family protein
MNKTQVDDMLIEMIEPKIKEINEKFSNGGKLTQDDINTLLLKSQYNHINHLDDKLNETVESVKNLEHKFESLEHKFENLKQQNKSDFNQLKTDIEVAIQKALNKNMMLLITIIGMFLVLSKIIDKF